MRSEVVGAQLGEEAISSSLKAAAIGLVIVMIFMIVQYLVPGVVAAFALAIYTTLVIATLYLFEITLTLPGIAGIILSIGMAVDANVIIFARIREEIADGKSVAQLLASCYCSGAEVDWKRYFAGVSFHRVSLPCDNMTKKLFWHKTKETEEIAESAPAAPVAVETEKLAETPAIPAAPEELEAPQSMEEHLLQIFRSGLEDDTLQAEDSIFDAGANSMTILTLIDDLKDAGITLELAEFYQYDSAAKLAEYLESGQPAADAAAEEVSAPAEKTAEPQDLVQILLEACRSGLDDDTLTEDDSLFDAGINSMSMMMVIDDLEEQGLTLKLADFYDCETVRELAARMETQKGTV